MSEFFKAILPSLCVSVIMLGFNIVRDRKDKKREDINELRRKSERLRLGLVVATAKLAYALAMAVKNGHPNGEVEEGIEEYNKAMKNFRDHEQELITHNLMDR